MKSGMFFGLVALMLGWSAPLQAFESEDELKVAIIGKLAKFVSGNQSEDQFFTITILNNPFGELPEKVLQQKEIHHQSVKINHIKSLRELHAVQVLFVPNMRLESLQKIIQSMHGKQILTISDSRGFAESGGMIQMYKVSQKIKLKINLKAAQDAGLSIRSSLLRIAQVIGKDS